MSNILNLGKSRLFITIAFIANPFCLFAQEADHVTGGIEKLKMILLVLAILPLVNLLLLFINFSVKTNALNLITLLASASFIGLAIFIGEGISVFTIPAMVMGIIGIIAGLKNFNNRAKG